ncbi:hypothetical protein CYMTET_13714 [Cymbomonas tetramitiformis]|uniref:Secreted protein n=1 Tax=Cymbomonas tetramitiformis TaxID=36881 RepID=A0AAE0GHY5_9CHLO|nr:hypothetical protein CYMTET_13714 [Cymbomonas tetramitiformis]
MGLFGRSALTSLAVCTLFMVCATAAPFTTAAFGGAGMDAAATPPVGGAIPECPGVSLGTASSSWTPSIDNRGFWAAFVDEVDFIYISRTPWTSSII